LYKFPPPISAKKKKKTTHIEEEEEAQRESSRICFVSFCFYDFFFFALIRFISRQRDRAQEETKRRKKQTLNFNLHFLMFSSSSFSAFYSTFCAKFHSSASLQHG